MRGRTNKYPKFTAALLKGIAASGKTEAEVAKLAKVDPALLTKYLSGFRRPVYLEVGRLCVLLGLNEDEIQRFSMGMDSKESESAKGTNPAAPAKQYPRYRADVEAALPSEIIYQLKKALQFAQEARVPSLQKGLASCLQDLSFEITAHIRWCKTSVYNISKGYYEPIDIINGNGESK